jgi:hypothetical protein
MLDRLRTTLEQAGVFVAETVNYRRDASAYRVRWQLLPLRGASAKITHFISIQQEATTEDFVTSLTKIVRVTDFLSVRKAGSLRGSLELLGGAGVLMQLLNINAQSGMLTLCDDLRVQLETGRIVAVEHPHLIGLEALLDAWRQTTGAYGFLAVDLPRPAAPLELGPSVVLPHVAAAVAFAQNMEHFIVALEDVANQAGPCVVLRGRGFRLMSLQGQLADVPPSIARA